MLKPKPRCLITEKQQEILQSMVQGRWCPQGLAQRANIILRSFAGQRNDQIAETLDIERHSVGLWRNRWKENFERLVRAECCDKKGELRNTIMEVLQDQPRAGRRRIYTNEQIALILAVACEPPGNSGRPITHWTHQELADEVIKRKIVTAISARHIGRFLKDSGASAASKPLLAECSHEEES